MEDSRPPRIEDLGSDHLLERLDCLLSPVLLDEAEYGVKHNDDEYHVGVGEGLTLPHGYEGRDDRRDHQDDDEDALELPQEELKGGRPPLLPELVGAEPLKPLPGLLLADAASAGTERLQNGLDIFRVPSPFFHRCHRNTPGTVEAKRDSRKKAYSDLYLLSQNVRPPKEITNMGCSSSIETCRTREPEPVDNPPIKPRHSGVSGHCFFLELPSPLFPETPLKVPVRAVVHGHAASEQEGRGEGDCDDQIIPDQGNPC